MKHLFLLLSVSILFLAVSSEEADFEGLQSLVNQLNPAQKQELDAIKNDKDLTKARFQARIKTFIDKLPKKLKAPASEIYLKIENLRRTTLLRAHDDASGLSVEAKNAVEKILAIKYDMEITQAQEKEQILKVKKELSEEAQIELQGVLKKLKQQMFNDYVTVIFH